MSTPQAPLQVWVIETGVANIASMMAALRRLGVQAALTQDPELCAQAQAVILPGVGAFGAGMQRLRALGMDRALRARFEADRPTLCVCLGLQLLTLASQESPGEQGLGLVDAQVVRFRSDRVLVPQLGWNHVQPRPECALLTPGYAYFANSYHIEAPPEGWRVAMSEHGEPFCAAMERGAWLACQFHPELSGAWGLALMGRWLDLARERSSC